MYNSNQEKDKIIEVGLISTCMQLCLLRSSLY